MKESVERQTLDLFLAIENKFDTVKKITTVANELTKAKEVKRAEPRLQLSDNSLEQGRHL